MDLQSLFYILAIIFMIVGIIVLIGLLSVVIFLSQKVSETQKLIEKKVNDFTKPVDSIIHKGTRFTKKLLDKFVS